jgi:hypothetical protein
MRNNIYINDKCYTKETLLIELCLLAGLQGLSLRQNVSVSELVNKYIAEGINNDTSQP